MKESKILVLIILLAVIFRIFFILKTNIFEYQYDFGNITVSSAEDYDNLYNEYDKGETEGRHIHYIMYIYNNWNLPSKIIGQFYHPPLHHIILALWLKGLDFISNDNVFKLESMQFISLVYSTITLITLYKILKELEIKNKVLPMLIFSFYPIFVFFSGGLNNDGLLTMFALICLLYLIKWEKKPTYKNTVIGALSIGLGAMTKTSMFVMMVPAIYIFLKVLNEHVKSNKDIKKLLIELFIFCIIVFPLAFWYHFYRGGQSLGIIAPFDRFSVKDKSLYERFGLSNPFRIREYNIWNSTMITSIVYGDSIYNLLVFVIVGLDLLLIINWIYLFIKSNKNDILIITNITWWLSYIYLFITMPYITSINSRYIMIPIVIGIIDIANGLEKIDNKYIKAEVYTISSLICLSSILYIVLL